MVERINTARSNTIARESNMSMDRLYPRRSGRHTEEILKVQPQVLLFTGRNEHAGLSIRIKYRFDCDTFEQKL